jgi:hypothetical protein
MARAVPDQPLATTLLELVWSLGHDENLTEEEIALAILELIEAERVRLTGTYRDVLTAPALARRLGDLN